MLSLFATSAILLKGITAIQILIDDILSALKQPGTVRFISIGKPNHICG